MSWWPKSSSTTLLRHFGSNRPRSPAVVAMRPHPYVSAEPYRTKDGSEIRELMHPAIHRNAAQSLAEATVRPGGRTLLHLHRRTEELYHVTAGEGRMSLGSDTFLLRVGDTVCIPPGVAHCIEALGEEPLRLLCCCAPAYDHEDTELLEEAAASPVSAAELQIGHPRESGDPSLVDHGFPLTRE